MELPTSAAAEPPALTFESARTKGVRDLIALLRNGFSEEKDIVVRVVEDLAFSTGENRATIVREGALNCLRRFDGTEPSYSSRSQRVLRAS